MVNFQGFGVAAKIRAKRYRIVLEYLRNIEWVHFGERNEVVFRRDNETRGGREDETTGRRDNGTTRLLKTQAFSGILRHSQSWGLRVAVRGSLTSEWCRCGASQKKAPRDST